ncbi:anti-sigma factor family protein [Fictibacillus phosphorivorans]|uniref:anti-sigma factor family protein n=1 Tax=Fictibacillus phosphorivorans TaxID=1221500 RepID=UPI00203DF0F8|nr:zf-HC2 domain-containing protein [Fictibacillus phosphorivorans]MCM3719453.1 zf-HC2 domain-containing protein [Fictibacillus phosphorivorans]MCM3777069.1 zf-HC2 domain-containing protein [Fictibacillus phosphorivorans]
MQCEASVLDELMNKVLDGEATQEEEHVFYTHLEECESCKEEYEMLLETLKELQYQNSTIKAPEGFTQAVMAKLPKEKQQIKWRRWMKRHPALTAAAIFMFFMAASVFTSYNQQDLAVVKGEGNLEIKKSERVVVVPAGETIKGDLVVENADVRIEGKVEGNVTVIKGNQYLASAGEVTGHSQEIGQVVEWVWYKLKSLVSTKEETMQNNDKSRLETAFFNG